MTRAAAARYARKSKPSVSPEMAIVRPTSPAKATMATAGRAVASGRPPSCLVMGGGPRDPFDATMDQRRQDQVPRDTQRQGWSRAHSRSALVCPADRDDSDRIAAFPGEEDQLDVKHDAGDLLSREQVVRGGATESLEPALRVLDRANHPD